MTRLRIVAVTAAVVIALAAWWVPLKVGSGCPGGGVCAEESLAPGGSGNSDRFYGGEGIERIREGDRPDARERTGGWRRDPLRP